MASNRRSRIFIVSVTFAIALVLLIPVVLYIKAALPPRSAVAWVEIREAARSFGRGEGRLPKDPWGNLLEGGFYSQTERDKSGEIVFEIRSLGPDKRRGTVDDLFVRFRSAWKDQERVFVPFEYQNLLVDVESWTIAFRYLNAVAS